MSLAQDQPQASQAQNILDEQQYQKDLVQYEKDKKVYDKEKAAYDLQIKNIKDAESAEKKRLEDARKAAEKEAERRAAEIKAVNEKYSAMKNPYPYRAGMKGKSFDNSSYINWNTSTSKAKQAELSAITMKNVKADGFQPASINRGGFIPYPTHPTARKLYTGEAINQHTAKALKNNTPASSIGNRWTRYQVEISRANAAVYAGGSLSAHASAVQSAKDTFDGKQKQEQLKFSAAARKESVNQLSNDAKHWNQVINDPNTSKDLQKTNQAALEKQGLHVDVKSLDNAGVSSIYNVLDMSKSGSLPSSATVTINSKSYNISNRPDSVVIPTRTNTSGNKGVNKANITQKQYVQDLRDGKVGLAQALLKPQTPQSYSAGNTINLKRFLSERGYDINRPETIPDSVLTTPVKYDAARKQAAYAEKTNTTMGDLRGFIPRQPKVSDAVLQQRQNALSFMASKEGKGGSYIGYGPDGTPVQGAAAPDPDAKTQWVVDSGKTGNITSFGLDGSSFVAREKTDPLLFDTKEQAQAYIDYQNKTNPFTISEGFSRQGNNSKQYLADTYKFLDDAGKNLQSDEGIGGTLYRGLSWQGGNPVGVAKMGVGAAIQIDNLATQSVAPYVSGSLPPTPLVQSSESPDQIVFPYDFEKGRFKTGEEIASASSDYMKTYGTGDFTSGVVGGYWIGPKGVRQLLRPMGIGGQTITMQTTAKTIAGAPVQEAVPVAKEFKLFGKTVATKTYDNPTIISSVEKLKLADTSGSYSWGKTSAAEVLAKADITPQGRGLELMTGAKQQTQFNKAVVQELVKQGKMNPSDVKFVENIERGVELARKQKPVMYSGFGEKPLKFIPSGPITQAILRGIGKAQSPINFTRLKTRLGQVGGSMAQDTQLRPKYQKGAKHDFDIDAPKTDDAVRHTKTIYDEAAPYSTDDVKIQLASNKKKITVTSKETGGKPDEFVELLDSKDAVKYQSVAQESGLRFGEKYRTDKLSKVLKQPLKESDSGIKVRDIKDQILAKASSVVSLQGKTTEKFKGVTEVGSWEAKQNKLIDDGVLHVDPPALRGKDTVDLYKIFKSRAEELSESISPIKKAQGRELDEIAESIKSRSPQLDFTQKSGEVTSYVVPEKSVSSLASDSLKSYSYTPTLVPTTISMPNPSQKPKTTSSVAPRSVAPRPSLVSLSSKSSKLSKSYSVTPGSLSSTSKSISSSSKLSVSSPSKSSISTSKSSPSKSSPNRLSPSRSTPRPSRLSRPSRVSRASRITRESNPSVLPPRSSRRTTVFNLDSESTEKKQKSKKGKSVDFLGNTRTYHIVGLFKRTEVIRGDKASAKQLVKDKKYKEGVKKKRNKVKKDSFMQKQGIVRKGFKF